MLILLASVILCVLRIDNAYLLLNNFDTIPLSNGFDNHGKYVAHIMKTDNIGLVVGYLHKFLALSKELRKVGDDNLSALKAYRIPTVFIVPENKQEKAKTE